MDNKPLDRWEGAWLLTLTVFASWMITFGAGLAFLWRDAQFHHLQGQYEHLRREAMKVGVGVKALERVWSQYNWVKADLATLKAIRDEQAKGSPKTTAGAE